MPSSYFHLEQDMLDKKQSLLDKIIGNLPNHARIADFGCGEGHFLKNLALKNDSYQLFGYDIKNRDDLTDIHYTSLDLDGVFDGVYSNQFDFVISQHVIEHLKNPLVYFSEMVRTLKVGGYLFIEAPSDRSTLFSYPFDQHLNLILSYYDDPTHVGRPWSPQSLYRLARYHHLDIYCSEYDSDFISKIKLPFEFARFLLHKDTDKFVDVYWKALGWCSYAAFQKTQQSTHDMNYHSFKGYPHGVIKDF